MGKHFSIEDRVRISDSYHWAMGALGTVIHPPAAVVKMSDGWRGACREVGSLRGMLTFYWVEFDQAQLDADGDGPYAEAEIDSDYLLMVEN